MGSGQSTPAAWGERTTADQVMQDPTFASACRGKTVLVTGATGGLGLESARVLAQHGATVVLAGRSGDKLEKAAASLRAKVPDARLDTMLVDLGNLASVKKAADAYVASGKRLDVLINNAGVMACPKSFTTDDLEMQFGTNHIGHFVLTNRLLPALQRSAPARVVNLSSMGHYLFEAFPNPILFDDLHADKSYDMWQRYSQAKLANILHAKELQRRYGKQGITAVALHPGTIMETELMRHSGMGAMLHMLTYGRAWSPLFEHMKTTAEGAATTVFCALAPIAAEGTDARKAGDAKQIVGGEYYSDVNLANKRVAECTRDADLAKKLWEVSERIVADKLK